MCSLVPRSPGRRAIPVVLTASWTVWSRARQRWTSHLAGAPRRTRFPVTLARPAITRHTTSDCHSPAVRRCVPAAGRSTSDNVGARARRLPSRVAQSYNPGFHGQPSWPSVAVDQSSKSCGRRRAASRFVARTHRLHEWNTMGSYRQPDKGICAFRQRRHTGGSSTSERRTGVGPHTPGERPSVTLPRVPPPSVNRHGSRSH